MYHKREACDSKGIIMKIEKKYWQWTEELNETAFKLGDSIQELVNKGLVQRKDGHHHYSGVEEVPWLIDIDDKNTITSICYRGKFLSINGEYIGDLDFKTFVSKIDSLLKPADENYSGSRLSAVFRGSYLAIIIIRK